MFVKLFNKATFGGKWYILSYFAVELFCLEVVLGYFVFV